MLIIKVGGSVITDKSRYLAFRNPVMDRIAEVLSHIREQMIIVHGAGSFGHLKAKEFDLPGRISERTLHGMNIVHTDVIRLNNEVLQRLRSHGLNVSSLTPFSLFNGRRNYSLMRRLISLGVNTVSHGDVYLTRESVNIISGDTIVRDLARLFRPRRVVFMSDVDGVYDRDPKKIRNAHLLRTVSGHVTVDGVNNDVTGGMRGKLNAMFEISRYAGETVLMNGFHPERLNQIGTESFIGTIIGTK